MQSVCTAVSRDSLLPFVSGEDQVTLRAVSRFWHELVKPIPLVKAFARSRVSFPIELHAGLCAHYGCTFRRSEIIFCDGHGRTMLHKITSPYCPNHLKRLGKSPMVQRPDY